MNTVSLRALSLRAKRNPNDAQAQENLRIARIRRSNDLGLQVDIDDQILLESVSWSKNNLGYVGGAIKATASDRKHSRPTDNVTIARCVWARMNECSVWDLKGVRICHRDGDSTNATRSNLFSSKEGK